jgi:hypothetical protein
MARALLLLKAVVMWNRIRVSSGAKPRKWKESRLALFPPIDSMRQSRLAGASAASRGWEIPESQPRIGAAAPRSRWCEAVVSPALRPGLSLARRPPGSIWWRCAPLIRSGLGGGTGRSRFRLGCNRSLTLPVRMGETCGSRWPGPACGFWLIVATGGAETDSRLRVFEPAWARSGCGDWVGGDFGKFTYGGDARGGGADSHLASARAGSRFRLVGPIYCRRNRAFHEISSYRRLHDQTNRITRAIILLRCRLSSATHR